MTELHLENNKTEVYPNLSALVKAHPEIEEVCLICRWVGHESRIENRNLWFDYEYDQLDWEYSFIGTSEGLEHFAENVSAWDGEKARVGIREGILYGQTTLYSDDPEGYKAPTLPPCTMEKGWMVSADRVTLSSITLPSGHTIHLKD